MDQDESPMKTLPNKLSELLLLAIDDAERVNKLDDYKLNMGHWHYTQLDTNEQGIAKEICHVCLAGAVMAMELDAESLKTHAVFPENFGKENSLKLRAINCMRVGEMFDAYRILHEHYTYPIDVEYHMPLDRASKLIGRSPSLLAIDGIMVEFGIYRQAADILEKGGL